MCRCSDWPLLVSVRAHHPQTSLGGVVEGKGPSPLLLKLVRYGILLLCGTIIFQCIDFVRFLQIRLVRGVLAGQWDEVTGLPTDQWDGGGAFFCSLHSQSLLIRQRMT